MKVFIQLYKDVSIALDLGSEYVKEEFNHPNIVVGNNNKNNNNNSNNNNIFSVISSPRAHKDRSVLLGSP